MTDKILVTGASGHLGRRVLHHLLETEKVPAGRLVATTREPSKLDDLSAKGVAIRAASFDDEAALAKAFEGADRVLVISTDSTDVPGKRIRQHETAVSAAVKAGAGHVAYTSMPKPEPGNPVLFSPDHYRTEQAIEESGLAHTIFRNNWYQENLMMALPQALKTGKWYTSAGSGRTAHIARDDVARAIAASLASGTGESATYTLTGPEALTNGEIAALASEITGKPIEVIDLSDDALAEGMKAAAVPESVVPLLVSFDANTRAGGLAEVTGDVERLTGRMPQPLGAFLEANKAALLG
ncbi:SDR family oxidoreductase [Chelativorans sp. AA-79]|uniref:SDR family oxidoreductase n=1 Tax=Chelativorans sp. AA-79 TaxID=3028735 RepID=UPI0023F7E828|nr:SDR family oxidoreductase [Chelativorans sp. AA-79]WEX11396.1 SDR family oxidoreductase [Chelativorans sp. AA-79]